MKIIKIKLFVNNVTQFTAYLANTLIQLFVNKGVCFTAYQANANIICIKFKSLIYEPQRHENYTTYYIYYT